MQKSGLTRIYMFIYSDLSFDNGTEKYLLVWVVLLNIFDIYFDF